MASKFSERLAHGTLVADGAMGTLLHARGKHSLGSAIDSLSLSHPEQVKTIHMDYLFSGSELIQTNTFGANAVRLSVQGIADQVEPINRASVALAKEANRLSGKDALIAGSMGPLGRNSPLFNVLDSGVGHNAFAQQASILSEEGVDVLLLETFPTLAEIHLAIQAARSVTDLPIIAQLTFTEEGRTPTGDTPQQVVELLQEMGVAAIGANCSVGPEPLCSVMEQMAAVAEVPLSVQPNAGFPAYQGGQLVYLASPEYMADRARYMAGLGVRLIGGCCGTTPEHIQSIKTSLLATDGIHEVRTPVTVREVPKPDVPMAKVSPTGFADRLENKKFIVTVEVDPPRGFDIRPTIASLADVEGIVHAVNVADNPRAQGRMGALAACSLIQGQLGIETIMHMAVRHRNLLALHSDLLGAHALGVQNIFTIMGDVPRIGDYPQATAISDTTPSGLVRLINAFNRGGDPAGRPLEQATSFTVGSAFNFGARDIDQELRVMERKVAAGAHYLMSQPVYDPEIVEQVARRIGGFPVPLILGILPLRSLRHAKFLDNEVPGISIPVNVLEKLEKPGVDAQQIGLSVSREVLRELLPLIGGAYFIPPFGRFRIVQETLEGLSIQNLEKEV